MGEEVIKTVLTADDKEFRAAFERSIKIIQQHEAKQDDLKKKALARATEEIRALKLEATGQKEAAAALRETLSLKDKALLMAKQTGLSEQASMVLLQKRLALEKQVAERAARPRIGPAAVPFAVIKPGQLSKLEQARSRSSMALLEISRGVEDAQYGIRGVLNNIPGTVLALGGTAGLAGALSLAAVAASVLGPQLAKLFKSGNREELEAYNRQVDALNDKMRDLARARGELASDRLISALAKEEEAYGRVNQVLAANATLQEVRRRANQSVASARAQSAVEGVAGNGAISPEGKRQRLAELEEAQLRAATKSRIADLKSEAKAAERTAEEAVAAAGRKQIEASKIRDQITAAEEKRAGLQKRFQAAARADLVEVQLQQSKAYESAAYADGAMPTNAETTRMFEEQARLAAELARQRKLAANAGEAERREIAQLDGFLKNQLAAAVELVAAEKQLAEAVRQTGLARDVAVKSAEAQITAAQAVLQIELDDQKKRQRAAVAARSQAMDSDFASRQAQGQQDFDAYYKDQAEKAASRLGAKADFGVELDALKLEAAGRKDLAAALLAERKIREDALALAERTGLSEAKATALVKERERLQRRLREDMRGEEESKIRRSARDTGRRIEAGSGRRIEAGGGRRIEAAAWRQGSLSRSGLRDSTVERRARETKGAAATDRWAEKFYREMLSELQVQSRVFQNLGIV